MLSRTLSVVLFYKSLQKIRIKTTELVKIEFFSTTFVAKISHVNWKAALLAYAVHQGPVLKPSSSCLHKVKRCYIDSTKDDGFLMPSIWTKPTRWTKNFPSISITNTIKRIQKIHIHNSIWTSNTKNHSTGY